MAKTRQKIETTMQNPQRIEVEEYSGSGTYLVIEDDNHDVIRIALDASGNTATAIYSSIQGRVHQEMV
jgi:hypothetical protein